MADKFKPCSVNGCNANAHRVGHGYCKKHYARWRRHGDPENETHGDRSRKELERVLQYEGNECLIWPLSRDVYGRGVVFKNGKRGFVHRLSCEEEHGPPPSPDHVSAHSCGKGHIGCVSRKHVRWATQAENIADKITHGTSPTGTKNAMAKLTEADILEIRSMASELSQHKIAKVFGVTQSNVNMIINRVTWGHI